jgi:hypothetical protein
MDILIPYLHGKTIILVDDGVAAGAFLGAWYQDFNQTSDEEDFLQIHRDLYRVSPPGPMVQALRLEHLDGRSQMRPPSVPASASEEITGQEVELIPEAAESWFDPSTTRRRHVCRQSHRNQRPIANVL